jgi:hypothetical protein
VDFKYPLAPALANRSTDMLAPCFWLRSPTGLIAFLTVLGALAGLVPSATAQAPAPALQYGFGPNDTLKVIHDLSGNGYDGTVLNPADGNRSHAG